MLCSGLFLTVTINLFPHFVSFSPYLSFYLFPLSLSLSLSFLGPVSTFLLPSLLLSLPLCLPLGLRLSLCPTLFLLIPGSARDEKVKLWGCRHISAQVAWQGAWCMVTLFLTRVRGDSGDKVSDQQPGFHSRLPGGIHSKGSDTEALNFLEER